MSVLSLDFETRSTVNLKDQGGYRYAQDPTTEIWVMAYAFDDEEPELWWPDHVLEFLGLDDHSDDCSLGLGGGCDCNNGMLPKRIIEHIKAGGEMRAWNAQFERLIWQWIMVARYGAPAVKREQWVCTAAEAAAMALPRSLDQCALVTKITETKDQEGYNLMQRMSRPRSIDDDGTLIWWYEEDRLHRLGEYCKQDVRTERAQKNVLRRLEPRERELYLLDQTINDRGIHLDRELVMAAKDIVDVGVSRANAMLEQLTGGVATKVSNPAAIKEWLGQQGVANESLDKAAVRDLLASDLEPKVREVVELRAGAGRSSVAKLDTMLEVVSQGDQLRGLALYHGATTGRWSGKLVQPHNFPSPKTAEIEAFIPLVQDRAYDAIDLIEHPITIVSDMLRSMLVARPGHDFVAADYSGIEMRVLNWFAQQEDILELLRNGEDVYSYNAARMTGTPYVPGKKHPQRQGGKFQELACGYQMGWRTAKKQAATPQYNITLTDEQAKDIVNSYRSTHDKVRAFWGESETAAFEAVRKPGSVVTFGALRNLIFTQQGAYLYLILPSKRPLVYASPAIEEVMKPWGEMGEAVTAWAVDGYTKKWAKHSMYGGLWVENIVQAAARDLLAEGMLRVEKFGGYEVVLHVHDEVVAEVHEKSPASSLKEFQSLLSVVPEWATGCPIATEGWRGKRYRK